MAGTFTRLPVEVSTFTNVNLEHFPFQFNRGWPETNSNFYTSFTIPRGLAHKSFTSRGWNLVKTKEPL